jgi:hypothetical protein
MSADSGEEGRACHKSADLTQAGHVERNAGDVADMNSLLVFLFNQRGRKRGKYRINVADVPRQRPTTPEEETISRVVERMMPGVACLDRH